MASVVPTTPTRPRSLVVASAFGTGAVLAYFGGLFALYFSIRADAIQVESVPFSTQDKPCAMLLNYWVCFTIS